MSPEAQALTDTLSAEHATASQLLACLHSEHEALKQLSAEALETAVARKIALLAEMDGHARKRTQLLNQLGFGSSTEDIQTYIDQNAPSVAPLWRQLVELAAELDAQNQINGSMIQLSQQRTQMALDMVARPEDRSRTYGKQGYAEPDYSSFTSVKA
ncbi:MAG: flagellar protein FlgN [Gammaproteobacteria bacterium]|nr:flagellar protein FlgN [Gammaproteobacteria bacterium]